MCKSDDCHTGKRHSSGSCQCGSRHDNFLDPCLLLLIAQDPSHGYDLVARLKRYGFEGVDPTRVYRRLRRLDDEGFLESAWLTENPGAARRAYKITEEGLDFLQSWPASIAAKIDSYRSFIDDVGALAREGKQE